MTRLFNEHYKRKETSLNGGWTLLPDFNDEGVAAGWANGLPAEGARKVIVPGVWNLEPGLFHHFGVCWYEKEVVTGSRAMFEFGAVTGLCTVYLDGVELGSHYGGFSAFRFIADTEPGAHKLILRVDASSNMQTIPLPYVDWYHYGGIIRDVTVSDLPDAYIENVHYEYELNDDLTAACVTAKIKLQAFAPCTVPVKFILEGADVAEETVTFTCATKTELALSTKVENVRLWDVLKGEMYSVGIETCCDDLYDRIGFRKIETKGTDILLNGKSLFLKGVNRHEEHPDWGFAVPAAIGQKDINIILDMGCNTIRGSHYPNSKVFMDQLDDAGLLFWSEIPMWGFSEDRMKDPVVLERGLTMHKEMTEQYYNHPSICLWGINNECSSNTEGGYQLCELYTTHLRAEGGNRLITFATNVVETDICFPLMDVISVNKYIGWYGEEIEGWNKFIPWLRQRAIECGVGDKPIVMSEFGTAAVYGFSDFTATKWTEEYQARLLKLVTELCIEEPGIAGTYVWQYCDIRSENELNRARSYNNKGIVNEYRRPKLAYYTMKDIYTKIK